MSGEGMTYNSGATAWSQGQSGYPQQQQQQQQGQWGQAAPSYTYPQQSYNVQTMQQAPQAGYQDGYQQAVRDMSNRSGGNPGGQVLAAVINAGVFLGLPLYFLYRLNKGGSGPGGSKVMSQMMEQMNPIPKRNFRTFIKDTKFKDVIGIEEAKEEVQEYVEFLRNPTQYQELGARLPKGALLTGKPGTGKTLLAKAVAGEADVAFFSADGSDFIEIFGGSGPKRVRELFEEARKNAPAVVFIDELDAVGSKRQGMGDQGIGGEENRTTNALLAEMDGMDTTDNVVVFAATNHPEALDTALVRAGRFDRKIEIPVPDEKARVDLFSFYMKKIVTAENFDEKSQELELKRKEREANALKPAEREAKQKEVEKLEKQLEDLRADKTKSEEQKQNMEGVIHKSLLKLRQELGPVDTRSKACSVPPTSEDLDAVKGMADRLAARTPGITPATIATVSNEAAIVGARAGASFVTEEHVSEALDNVLIGKKHRQRMSPPALKRVAYHEAGHTVVQWLLPTQTSVIKVSIVPRGRAGGYTQFRQTEDLDPKTQQFLQDQIVVMLGGRCAEQIFFNDMTTGAQDDLQRAFQSAQAQVQVFGMSDVGHISVNNQSESRGRAFSQLSESLKTDVEKTSKVIVDDCYARCMKLLKDNKDKLEAVAQLLLEKKEVQEADLVKILGEKPAVKDL
eukprot:TRINITY_DN1003_c0_g1_i1.p1 TRINITY_DN1003_c0_g1~~TRINITY_DN1003_c0_g1_i1.p1  ORF type:complete len:680 (+),score=349.84 TRINITY_DN1003_c0_g1_i1:275-2314(+)